MGALIYICSIFSTLWMRTVLCFVITVQSIGELKAGYGGLWREHTIHYAMFLFLHSPGYTCCTMLPEIIIYILRFLGKRVRRNVDIFCFYFFFLDRIKTAINSVVYGGNGVNVGSITTRGHQWRKNLWHILLKKNECGDFIAVIWNC